ncbi:MAG: methylated-DNA--[protein]-cysteine S-methyltransferase [Rubrivivax sp.]|nr:MAG: methylated-DNA--[protein]-cysteine S-methyltransferase [Rubrivivax sp.]
MNPVQTPRQKPCFAKQIDTPVGRLRLVGDNEALAAILWENDRPGRVPLNIVGERPDHPVLVDTERQLHDYFAGRRTVFELQLDFRGTDFQRKVWQALLTIPFGETRSYAEIARQIGQPTAVRAVGAANGRNPISIIAPCHRVIGSGGALTGFAGGVGCESPPAGPGTAAPARHHLSFCPPPPPQ